MSGRKTGSGNATGNTDYAGEQAGSVQAGQPFLSTVLVKPGAGWYRVFIVADLGCMKEGLLPLAPSNVPFTPSGMSFMEKTWQVWIIPLCWDWPIRVSPIA
ncbi:hypothetical protein ACFJIV_29070 [Mucilaginibacter sp. UC70_90]